jgi:branched-chain amino acid transport system ATP-binding protein
MLTARNVTAGYGRRAVLHAVNFTVRDGSVTAILAGDGGGKTTLADAICGILPVSEGQVIYRGEDITHTASHDRIARGISYVPAGLRLFPRLSVFQNMQLGAAAVAPQNFRDGLEFVLSLFPQLKGCLDFRAGTLPGSVQRAVMVARGVISGPCLLVLDQPSSGLNAEEIHHLFHAISRVNGECGTAVLLLEQRMFQALKLAESAYLLEKGRITGERSALELLADRALQANFFCGIWQPQSNEAAA